MGVFLYGPNDTKGCNAGCGKKHRGAREFYTCGAPKCRRILQKIALEESGNDNDGRDPSKGMKIERNGKSKTVKYSKTVGGKLAYVCTDGSTEQASRVNITK